ncbi:hypothetical protein EVAR_1030_1 [Eumeta japonica]|uniref:Uncharacterized protein n=1 Tax=Eumeta variegata TaxID=151549 RepID=A0A4C1SEC5_EUMVA|nr:hypothetical protein EVAR_1030_1 [Eumeta japonica]
MSVELRFLTENGPDRLFRAGGTLNRRDAVGLNFLRIRVVGMAGFSCKRGAHCTRQGVFLRASRFDVPRLIRKRPDGHAYTVLNVRTYAVVTPKSYF